MRFEHAVALIACVSGLIACVPPQPPPPRPSAEEIATRTAARTTTRKPRVDPNAKRTDGLKGGELVFEDHFERTELGADWEGKHPGEWVVRDGKLVANRVKVYDDRNKGLWLQRKLPANVRVQFTGRVRSAQGDMKCEIFARTDTHEAGYSVIFGGWNNSINTITRLGEHEPQRVVQHPHLPVRTGVTYQWTLVRTADATLRWYIDGNFMAAYEDKAPVKGAYFGFNNWLSDVEFDDLQIFDLGQTGATSKGPSQGR